MKEALLALIGIPLLGALLTLFTARHCRNRARTIALTTTLLTLVVSLGLVAIDFCGWGGIPGSYAGETRFLVLGTGGAVDPLRGISFHIGLDGISLGMIFLTGFLFPAALFLTSKASAINDWGFLAWYQALQGLTFGAFLSLDLVLFYVFFELTLVPLFFMIGGWGGSLRIEAATKMFLYGLTGSLFTLGGIVGVSLALGGMDKGCDFSIPRLVQVAKDRGKPMEASIDMVAKTKLALEKVMTDREKDAARAKFDEAEHDLLQKRKVEAQWFNWQTTLFLMLMAGLAVKIPIIPVHFWQPLAYREAPIALTVVLSAALAKLGLFGVVRIVLPLLPDASARLATPVLGTLATIGILYGGLAALGASNLRLMLAFSSISHLGFCLLGIVSLNETGLAGGVLQMINHGITTGGLWLFALILLERFPSLEIHTFTGMGKKFKAMGVVAVLLVLSSVGLPGLNNFVGEVLSLLGMFAQGDEGRQLAVLASLGLILGAWYMLNFLLRAFYGDERIPAPIPGRTPTDLTVREKAVFAPILALCLLLGLCPQYALKRISADTNLVAKELGEAKRRLEGKSWTESKISVSPTPESLAPDKNHHLAPQTKKGGAQ